MFDNFNIGDLKQSLHLMMGVHESAATHALLMVADPDHECDADTDDYQEEAIAEAPPITDAEARIFFAYEESMKLNFALIRKTMKHQGLPVYSEVEKT